MIFLSDPDIPIRDDTPPPTPQKKTPPAIAKKPPTIKARGQAPVVSRPAPKPPVAAIAPKPPVAPVAPMQSSLTSDDLSWKKRQSMMIATSSTEQSFDSITDEIKPVS